MTTPKDQTRDITLTVNIDERWKFVSRRLNRCVSVGMGIASSFRSSFGSSIGAGFFAGAAVMGLVLDPDPHPKRP